MDNHTGVPFPPPLVPALAIGAGVLASIWVPRFPVGLPWMIAGGTLFALAACFAGWALVLMRIRRTTPSPFGAASALLSAGPYRWSRNPMYCALIAAQAAVGLAFGLVLTIGLLPLSAGVIEFLVIRREEAWLRATFPAEFEAYAARVRRWL
jgi:protein-S-isoprenylcysteine O-methyltransferase Ste14